MKEEVFRNKQTLRVLSIVFVFTLLTGLFVYASTFINASSAFAGPDVIDKVCDAESSLNQETGVCDTIFNENDIQLIEFCSNERNFAIKSTMGESFTPAGYTYVGDISTKPGTEAPEDVRCRALMPKNNYKYRYVKGLYVKSYMEDMFLLSDFCASGNGRTHADTSSFAPDTVGYKFVGVTDFLVDQLSISRHCTTSDQPESRGLFVVDQYAEHVKLESYCDEPADVVSFEHIDELDEFFQGYGGCDMRTQALYLDGFSVGAAGLARCPRNYEEASTTTCKREATSFSQSISIVPEPVEVAVQEPVDVNIEEIRSAVCSLEKVVDLDTDGDYLPDEFEKLIGTDINNRDTDGDGLPDQFEVCASMTNPNDQDTNNNGVEDALENPDRDDMDNAAELGNGTNPLIFDETEESVETVITEETTEEVVVVEQVEVEVQNEDIALPTIEDGADNAPEQVEVEVFTSKAVTPETATPQNVESANTGSTTIRTGGITLSALSMIGLIVVSIFAMKESRKSTLII